MSQVQDSKDNQLLKLHSTNRTGLNSLFELKNPLVEYTIDRETKNCADLSCQERQACLCSLCSCCSVCSGRCDCPQATLDPNKKLAELLGFGDEKYRYNVFFFFYYFKPNNTYKTNNQTKCLVYTLL